MKGNKMTVEGIYYKYRVGWEPISLSTKTFMNGSKNRLQNHYYAQFGNDEDDIFEITLEEYEFLLKTLQDTLVAQ